MKMDLSTFIIVFVNRITHQEMKIRRYEYILPHIASLFKAEEGKDERKFGFPQSSLGSNRNAINTVWKNESKHVEKK